jgi:ABC-type multidrug transport system fused ATPase/permease subunit
MFKRLLGSVRQYWFAALLSPLSMIGEVYMEVRIPGIISQIVDHGITPGNITVVW